MSYKEINHSLKNLIFFFFLFCLSNCTEKGEDSSSPEREPVSRQTESKQLIEVPTVSETPAVKKKPVRRKKTKRAQKQIPDEKATITIAPLEKEPIALLAVPSEIVTDTIALATQMEDLVKTSLTQYYEVHKMYNYPAEYKLNPNDLIIPVSLITIGAIASHTKNKDIFRINRVNIQNRKTPVDDITQFAIAPSLFVFDAFSDAKNRPADQFFITLMSYGIMVLPVRIIKHNYNSLRPYGGESSFPSGHTATAFVGSHIIYKEFKDSNPVIAYSGYAMGAFVAGLRVANDKHWVSDVLAGAGIAMLSTELAYLIYQPVKNLITEKVNKRFDNYPVLSPIIQTDAIGFNFSLAF